MQRFVCPRTRFSSDEVVLSFGERISAEGRFLPRPLEAQGGYQLAVDYVTSIDRGFPSWVGGYNGGRGVPGLACAMPTPSTPDSVGVVPPASGQAEGVRLLPLCAFGNLLDRILIGLDHPPFGGAAACIADGPGCLSLFRFDWATAGTLDLLVGNTERRSLPVARQPRSRGSETLFRQALVASVAGATRHQRRAFERRPTGDRRPAARELLLGVQRRPDASEPRVRPGPDSTTERGGLELIPLAVDRTPRNRATPLLLVAMALAAMTLAAPLFVHAQDYECALEMPVSLIVVAEHNRTMIQERYRDENGIWTFRPNFFKKDQSATIAGGVVAEFERRGLLRAAGLLTIPTWDAPDNLDITAANVPQVLARSIAGFGFDSPTPTSHPLLTAIRDASLRLAEVPDDHRKILLLLNHTDSWGESTTVEQAAAAMLAAEVEDHLIILGAESRDSSHAGNARERLTRLANIVVPGFSGFMNATEADIVTQIVEARCGNYRPRAAFTHFPRPLILGDPGFELELNATSTRDFEDRSEDLDYEWSLGRTGPAAGERGEPTRVRVGQIVEEPFGPEDEGSWYARLKVADQKGATAITESTFEVVLSDPRVQLDAPTPVPAGTELVAETLLLTTSTTPRAGGLTFSWTVLSAPRDGTYPEGYTWTSPDVRWQTEGQDVTRRSDGADYDPPRPAWEFELIVKDDEGNVSRPEIATIQVRNSLPTAEIEGPGDFRVDGGPVELTTADFSDPDGGTVEVTGELSKHPTRRPSIFEQVRLSQGILTPVSDSPRPRRWPAPGSFVSN